MKTRDVMRRIAANETLNFVLTNRIPRALLTHFMGWFSRIERPWIRDTSIALWKTFADVDLDDSATLEFKSLHDCFTRALRPGARQVEPDSAVLTSPSDAIVGACGAISGTQVLQAKGHAYTLDELLGSTATAENYRDGCYVTLRLTSGMYHRFHAPHDGHIGGLTYVAGDAYNVNPPTVKRIERLFCRNEHALIPLCLEPTRHTIMLVPVAAILVASIRLHFVDVLLHLKYKGPNVIDCDAAVTKGQELGWFQHGSTILVLAPRGFTLCPDIHDGARIRMGSPLMRLPSASS
jgi:phosphatidylserine decarboxylase